MSKRIFSNYIFEEISIGDKSSLKKRISQEKINQFATLSGDFNPLHLSVEYAKRRGFYNTIAQGEWSNLLISAILGTQLPGPGTIYLKQQLIFKKIIFCEDVIQATITVKSKNENQKTLIFDCQCTNQKGDIVSIGEAEVVPPLIKIPIDECLIDPAKSRIRTHP
ncbi:MAG TPA: MaoC family dehydratase [Patescibacteria group bacterium]|nr:MaoC family dehydratase [Gammaproteobacteria bacterium]HWA51495.1 MaoC family dehydratase [Patescibacteria group bacterium]